METAYAQALWQMIQSGTAPKKALSALHEVLALRGRTALMPPIPRAFARSAARDQARSGIVLSVAQKKDEKLGLKAIKDILKEMSVKADEVALNVDESLVGGWRLEGRGRLVDASWKKDLLSIYNRSIA